MQKAKTKKRNEDKEKSAILQQRGLWRCCGECGVSIVRLHSRVIVATTSTVVYVHCVLRIPSAEQDLFYLFILPVLHDY